MTRPTFALTSTAGASLAQLLFCAAWFARLPTTDGGLQALLPGVLWIGGTASLVLSLPFWMNLTYQPWLDFRPVRVRNLLLLPWVLGLAATGLAFVYLCLSGFGLLSG